MKAIIFDTETTGIDEPVIVEAAWAPCDVRATELIVDWDQAWGGRFNPGKPISLGALATHHIMDEELVDCPPSSSFALPDGVEYIIGHNVDFDWKAIGQPPVRRICTLAMARHIYPAIDSHTQSALLYHLERDRARDILKDAHSADADIAICAIILAYIIDEYGHVGSLEHLWSLSEAARIPSIMPFGKHKGTPIDQVPSDYKAWLLRQPDTDPYLVKAIRGGH